MTTNYKRYRDEIIKFNYTSNKGSDEFCNNFIEPNILKPMGKRCLDVNCAYCRTLVSIWLLDQYKESEVDKEPKVDWSKVPVDTKIHVKDKEEDKWMKRYFAKYENGKVYAWICGYTSWTCQEYEVQSWKYTKLAEGGINENTITG